MAPVTRRAKISRAERRDEIAQRLFSAAEGMFDNGVSFTEISVEQLITEAEIARSTFYVYFEDKGALLLELADRVTQKLGDAALPWLELPPTATRDDLHHALTTLIDTYTTHRHMMTAITEAAAYDPRVREQYSDVINQRITFMTEHFLHQQHTGTIRPDVDIPKATPWIVWMIERGLYQLLGHGTPAATEHLDGLTDIIWHTLYRTTR